MGAKSSKDVCVKQDCVPDNFTRGCILSEESQDWRNDINYKNILNRLKETQSVKPNPKDYLSNASTSDLQNISTSGLCRLQSIGVNKKSYFQQLLQHRAKDSSRRLDSNESVNYELERGDSPKATKENGYQMVVSKIFKKKSLYTILKAFITGKEETLIKEVLSAKQQNVSKPQPASINFTMDKPRATTINNHKQAINTLHKQFENKLQTNSPQTIILHTKPSLIFNVSKDNSFDENTVPVNRHRKLSNKSSEVSIVTYHQAKARFENGLQKKVAGRSEALAQLEALGLGYWNNDRWIPTKIVTPAITGQLSCTDKDWPNSFPFKTRYSNNLNSRTACSEVKEF